jgi:hypothetical protein
MILKKTCTEFLNKELSTSKNIPCYCTEMKGFKVTQSLHHKGGFREKNRKLAVLLKGIKRPNRFIDSFLEKNIGVALIEYFFFLNRSHNYVQYIRVYHSVK